MKTYLQTIREACVKANPEIESKTFCIQCGESKGFPFLCRDETGVAHKTHKWVNTDHPIRLADVLLAIEAQGIEDDTPCVTTEGRFVKYDAETAEMILTDIYWNLRNDSLTEQPLATQKFISELLTKE